MPPNPVLIHHTLQFAPSAWKGIRPRLGAGSPQVAVTPDNDFPDGSTIDHRRRPYPEHQDRLGFHITAHTLFVVGSPIAFREHCSALGGLVDEAPSYPHRHPQTGHFWVEFSAGPWLRPRTRGNVPARLHIQYCDDWRAREPTRPMPRR
ncbi:hypothetical protein [Streptomyces sp. NBC_01013]|uniref:hypothetical protein n=1 Tax=Streptomyces sp. NBC_01013 TaxID=2903718 RepID=UPI00387095A8|nr:hypothetical protein OG538_12775 [Streptomyces sp. NBC_01013]